MSMQANAANVSGFISNEIEDFFELIGIEAKLAINVASLDVFVGMALNSRRQTQ